MAITFGDNLNFAGKKPDFVRQEYATFEDMRAVRKAQMPELYFAYCLEDRNFYKYDKSLDADPVTGNFRLFQSGGSDIQVEALPEAGESQLGKIYQYVGITGRYTRGFFYECTFTEGPEIVNVETVDDLKTAIELSTNVIKVRIDPDTINSTNGFFDGSSVYFVNSDSVYGGTWSDTVVETMDDLKNFIDSSEDFVTVKLSDDSTVEVKCIDNAGTKIFVYEDVIYGGTLVDDVVVLADATVYDTDEAVAALGIVDGKIVVLTDATLYDTDEAVLALGLSYEIITREYSWDNIDVSSGGGTIQTISLEEIDELFE